MSIKKQGANGSPKEPVGAPKADGTIKATPDTIVKKGSKVKSNGMESILEELDEPLNSRELLKVLAEVRNGNFHVRMPIDQLGLNGKICDTLNDIISLNERLMQELTKAGNTIGKQGKLAHRVELPYARGSWSNGIDSINGLISDLVHPATEIA